MTSRYNYETEYTIALDYFITLLKSPNSTKVFMLHALLIHKSSADSVTIKLLKKTNATWIASKHSKTVTTLTKEISLRCCDFSRWFHCHCHCIIVVPMKYCTDKILCHKKFGSHMIIWSLHLKLSSVDILNFNCIYNFLTGINSAWQLKNTSLTRLCCVCEYLII